MRDSKYKSQIAIIIFEDLRETNGTTIRLKSVMHALENIYNITLISSTPGMQQITDQKQVKLINLGYRDRVLLRSGSFLMKVFSVISWNIKLTLVLIKNRFDIIYYSHDWYGFFAAYIVSKLRNMKVIFEAHSIFSEESAELGRKGIILKLLINWEKFVIKHSNAVIALSQNTLESYQPHNRNITVIPLFVDENMFVRREYITKQQKLIGLIGPFSSRFNMYYLDFLYANIERFNPNISFIIIGNCEKRITHKRITYSGFVPSFKEYVALLYRLDALLIPSKLATSGALTKIVETMFCSVPVFTTTEGMVGLYGVEPNNDIFVYPEDILVDKINEILFNEEIMRKTSENARNAIEKTYSKQVNIERLLHVLDNM